MFSAAAARRTGISLFTKAKAGIQQHLVVQQQKGAVGGASVCYFSTENGTVKWFDVKKGFGFIIPDDGSQDVFVHQTAIHADGFRSLADGEQVEYSTVQDDRGRIRADRVTGPLGSFVQGAPRRSFRDQFDDGGSSFGGGGGGSYGGGGGFGGGGGSGSDDNEMDDWLKDTTENEVIDEEENKEFKV